MLLEVQGNGDLMLRDTLSRTGAEELKARIEDYWHSRGFAVTVDIAPDALFGDRIWVVRSDMINGLPRRR
jgi:hypothetical protein